VNDRITATLAARRDYLDKKEKGFTLVELLVVVLIIGILAAIAVPLFLAQRQGAWEAQVKSDLANAVIAAETIALKNNGSYALMTGVTLKENGYTATDGVTIVASPSAAATAVTGVPAIAAGLSYTLSATSATYTGQTWIYSSVTGKTVKSPTVVAAT
jgi:type IV pilus assembly protein PilA